MNKLFIALTISAFSITLATSAMAAEDDLTPAATAGAGAGVAGAGTGAGATVLAGTALGSEAALGLLAGVVVLGAASGGGGGGTTTTTTTTTTTN